MDPPNSPRIAALARAVPVGTAHPGRSRFDNAAKIRHVLAPKLLVHGDRDEVVPLGQGQRLFELAREPKRFALIAGAGHNDLMLIGGERYLAAWHQFLGDTRTAPTPLIVATFGEFP